MHFERRAFLRGLFGAGACFLLPWPSRATTAVALDLPTLVERSARVVLGTAEESHAEWRQLGGQRRILTYTRLLVHEDWLDSDDVDQQLWVRTLGGRVGDVHQRVLGAATVKKGETCVLFAGREEADAARPIVGMAQGHYPLGGSDDEPVLVRSRHVPHLVPGPRGGPGRRAAAVDRLHQLSLDQARREVREARR